MPSYVEKELLGEIRRVAVVGDTGGKPTLQQFREHSLIADTPILRRFGSWNDAVEQADVRSARTRYSDSNGGPACRGSAASQRPRMDSDRRPDERARRYSRWTYQRRLGS
ncbi:homing endonuclease associated repeat-containing protein [Halorubrum sp. Hd13]|uniref:homing endonuclease associated repeat-containing protein n=1 Tax=Halorubrum sp. Hd13 TaxID=1480728 RepID=UPI0037448C5C